MAKGRRQKRRKRHEPAIRWFIFQMVGLDLLPFMDGEGRVMVLTNKAIMEQVLPHMVACWEASEFKEQLTQPIAAAMGQTKWDLFKQDHGQDGYIECSNWDDFMAILHSLDKEVQQLMKEVLGQNPESN